MENMQLLEARKWAEEAEVRKAESPQKDLSEIREQATEEMMRTSQVDKPQLSSSNLSNRVSLGSMLTSVRKSSASHDSLNGTRSPTQSPLQVFHERFPLTATTATLNFRTTHSKHESPEKKPASLLQMVTAKFKTSNKENARTKINPPAALVSSWQVQNQIYFEKRGQLVCGTPNKKASPGSPRDISNRCSNRKARKHLFSLTAPVLEPLNSSQYGEELACAALSHICCSEYGVAPR